MINRGRIFSVKRVDSVEDLVRKLTRYRWKLCTAFYCGGFIYLNDSASQDGAQEYAVMRMDDFPKSGRHELDQVQSLKVSSCTEQGALEAIGKLGDAQPTSRVVVQVDGPAHICPLCA